jgi:MoxR-like ATPase
MSVRPDIEKEVQTIQQKYHIVGREKELRLMLIGMKAKKHMILEGAVGVGKTYLARALSHYINADFFRVDGSEDVLSHTLIGYFDPPMVLAKGYKEEAFIYGPLSEAMRDGACLFINELNRIPESTQNVLLSALDEQIIIVPKFKEIKAAEGFITLATQNPAAHVGVSALGEALKDRFLWIFVGYQSEEEEISIVKQNLEESEYTERFSKLAVKIIRLTREHPSLRRGSSIRGAIDLAHLAQADSQKPVFEVWYDLAIMALHSKIELMDGIDQNINEVIHSIVDAVFNSFL